MKLDKTTETIKKNNDHHDDHYRCDPDIALDYIWDLSLSLYSLSGKYDVQSRLQRSVENIQRVRR